MAEWGIVDEFISRDLEKLESNAPVMNAYKEFVRCVAAMGLDDDPATLGVRKAYKGKGAYGFELNRSYRLIYRIDRVEKKVVMAAIGDHKKIYGRG